MFSVIGGTYREVCLHPRWNALYGSGMRAAAAAAQIALRETGNKVRLYTWTHQTVHEEALAIAASYDLEIEINDRQTQIEFQYDHALGPARLYPESNIIQPITKIEIEASNALVFGLVEGNPTVKADRLVYDPQSGKRSIPPSDTQHIAQRLAIVANLAEAVAMLRSKGSIKFTDEHEPSRIAKALLEQEMCDVVVVKNGAEGAIVTTPEGTQVIPCYITERVFPLGSGDVFSGIFGVAWAALERDPLESAQLASAATAYYCQNKILPIPRHVLEIAHEFRQLPMTNSECSRPVRRVYLAGPLSTLPQLWLLNEAKRCLEEQGLNVFSPKDDVGFLPNLGSAEHVAEEDLEGLSNSDLVFAILDGFDPGTVFELGYARARNIPVVAFAECPDPAHITMLIGTQCVLFDDFPTAVYHASWKARTP